MLKRIFLIFLCFGCSRNAPQPEPRSKPIVLVSIAPYQFLVGRIAGEGIEVQAVVPPGANPHAFEPTSHQVKEMAEGVIWFRIGEPFEEKILPVLKTKNRELIAYDLREGIQLIEEGHSLGCSHCSMDHFDRHIWLSPKLAIAQAKAIEGVLSEKFPEKKELFQQNLERLSAELQFLHEEIVALLEPIVERVILVSHPAFGYFCQDYRFEQLSVEYEGKDPRPKHLEQVLQQAEYAEVALALPQYNNKGAQLIAERLHVPVHLIDPYSENYFETLRKLAHLIADPSKDYE
ncbi:MAG TPA: zinc ABC transporter substrate-binding protein [Chlamydiales bacterium]|nr:zinc ABC transporter substrate-binding protein [Chlamydiales bacterium]